MKTLNGSALVVLGALLAVAGIAYAAQPPDIVTSDAAANTAMGTGALFLLTGGTGNTASGFQALYSNKTGSHNTASGVSALALNIGGNENTAIGSGALVSNASGSGNTALGRLALYFNIEGSANTATGWNALQNNDTGVNNTGSGSNALFANTTGMYNTATGAGALKNSTSGFRNVALGYQAGLLVSGSDNITVGGDNQGKAAENGAIRIGNKTYQKKTFIAGIRGVTTGLAAAIPVFIDANGQLGTIKSSARFKEDIQPIGNVSERLYALRPVTFRYRQSDEDGRKPVQFGLIAEEVAKAFPELVIYDEEGKPETVSYHLLATLLLNEFQKEHSLNQQQDEQLAAQATQLAEVSELKQQLAEVKESLAALQPQSKELQVAQR